MFKEQQNDCNNPDEKIIRKLCKEILFPIDIFQRGSSRVYLDDNGWFFTVMEFQPSSWSKGTYLNIALHFLWNECEFLSYDFPFTGSRLKKYVEYHNDEQFEQAVKPYLETALQQVMFYRNLRDIETANDYAQKWASEYPKHPNVKELDIINRLTDEEVLQRIRRTRAYWRSKPAMKKMLYYEIYDEKQKR